jgi:hypothetical protein
MNFKLIYKNPKNSFLLIVNKMALVHIVAK